jgi:hypothetical protein
MSRRVGRIHQDTLHTPIKLLSVVFSFSISFTFTSLSYDLQCIQFTKVCQVSQNMSKLFIYLRHDLAGKLNK